MEKPPRDTHLWSSLVQIVATLRGPNGCPWDKEQTHRSLIPFAIEESFELAEAIEGGEEKEIVGELGDLLLQVVLHAQLAQDRGAFRIDDVIRAINEKMIRRHPHVFEPTAESAATFVESAAKAETAADVLSQWQVIKAKEKAQAGVTGEKTFSFDVPKMLPALQRAAKIGDKTRQLKFDWPNWQGVVAKIEEEVAEVKAALATAPSAVSKPKSLPEIGRAGDPVADEIGDLLFSVAQLARHRGFDPEQCLRETNARFERRFRILRDLEAKMSKTDGRDWASRSSEELEAMWQEAKVLEATGKATERRLD